jgi:ABC-2 type transport system ATP-binding protein
MSVVIAEHLSKTYYTPKKQPGVLGALKGLFTRQKNEVHAVKDVSFRIEAGELVGFLGPNGAGKTTTLKMLTGILCPTSGRCEVLGYTPFDRKQEMLRQIALVMGNKQQLWWDLPAWDSFVVLRELYGVEHKAFEQRVHRLIEELQLTDKVNTQVRKLSLGERMKCELVAALLHAPKVVFLDEPTIGLDVVSQKRIRDFLKDLNKTEQCTMVLTSHYMQDVQELCERVIVIDHGSVIVDGTLADLSRRHSDTRRLRLTFATDVDPTQLEKYGRLVGLEDGAHILEIPRSNTAAVTSAVLQALPVIDLSMEEPPIEEVIRELFSGSRRPPAAESPAR